MAKIVLTDLSNLQNETTAVNAINNNNAALIVAFQNTLSRDGTQPNQMGSVLDMNSNAIINLPTPTSLFEPLRLIDADLLNGGGSIPLSPLPIGGTTGQFLVKNSNTNFDVAWSSNIANIAVIPTGATTARSLALWMADDPYIEDFGGGAGLSDNGVAFNLALSSGAGGVRFREDSNYTFTTKPNFITRDFRISGGGQGRTQIIRAYTEASPTRGLFHWTGGQCYVKDLFFLATGTGGTCISINPQVPPANITLGNITNVRISTSGGTWDYCIYADGSALSVPLGLRTMYFNNVTCFGANIRSVFLKTVVHLNWNGGSISTAGGIDGSLEITGNSLQFSQESTINIDAIDGNLILDFVKRCNILVSHITGNITNTTNTTEIVGTGAVTGSLQANWTLSTWMSNNTLNLSNSTSILWGGGDVSLTIGASNGPVAWSGATVGGYTFDFTTYPASNRAGALGTASNGWADIFLGGSTSGIAQLKAPTSGGAILTLPSAVDTLVSKTSVDVLTNKTYDTAGTGNSFSINGLAATANTGTGAVVRATSPTLVTPALGTPSALVLTNATGLPVGSITGLGAGVGTFLATPSSANLITAVTDETGTGNLVFSTSPILKTLVTATANSGTPVTAALSGVVSRVVGADGATARIGIESYGTGVATAFSANNSRRANGTAAAPTAVQSGDLLFGYVGTGYGTSNFIDAGGAGVLGWASQTFTNAAGGTELAMVVTPNGAIANAEALRILNTGQLKLTGSANFIANNTVATVLGSLGPTGSHTTVQKWLTIVDNTGTTLYIPAF